MTRPIKLALGVAAVAAALVYADRVGARWANQVIQPPKR
jgi:hypothetical protein